MRRRLWLVIVTGVALFIATRVSTNPAVTTPQDPRYERLFALRTAASDARLQLGLARWQATIGNRAGVHITGLSDSLSAWARSVVDAQLDSLGLRASERIGVHVRPFDAEDTVSAASVGPLRFVWVLPAAPSAPCIAVIHVREGHQSLAHALSRGSIPGPCAFFAQFGQPGRFVRAWLDTARYSFAALPAWSNSAAPRVPAVGLIERRSPDQLSLRARSCLRGDDNDCLRVLGLQDIPDRARVPGDAYTLDVDQDPSVVRRLASGGTGRRLGAIEGEYLSDLIGRFGAERFGEFWTSPAPVADAFAAAFGVPLAGQTRDWLATRYDDRPGGPGVPLVSLLAAVGAILTFVAISVRRVADS